MLGEINQKEKDKYYIIPLICGRGKKANSQKWKIKCWLPGARSERYGKILVRIL